MASTIITDELLAEQKKAMMEQMRDLQNNPPADEPEDDQNEDINDEPVDEVFDDSADDDDSHQEEQPRKRKRGAKERIQELLNKVSKLEEALQSRTKEEITPIAKKKAEEVFISDAELKSEIMKGISSSNLDDVYKSIEKLSEHKAKRLLKEQLSEIAPIFEDLAIEKKAKALNADTEAIKKVFSEYPELRDMGEKGFELAKKLIGNSKSNKPAKAAAVGNTSARSSGSKGTSEKQLDPTKLTKDEIRNIYKKLRG